MSFDQWIQIAVAAGSWLAAVGTIVAACVALYLARRSERVRLKAHVKFWRWVGDGIQPEKVLMISVTNEGGRAVTINDAGWRIGRGKRKKSCILNLSPSSQHQFGKKLEYGETGKFILEESNVEEWSGRTIKGLAQYLVEEGFSDKSLKTLRAQIHTSVGHTEDVVPDEVVLQKLKEEIEAISDESTPNP